MNLARPHTARLFVGVSIDRDCSPASRAANAIVGDMGWVMKGEDRIGFDELNKSPRYRAVLLGASGEVLGMARLNVDDDATAIVEAKALVDGHAVELWDGVRLIEHFPTVD